MARRLVFGVVGFALIASVALFLSGQTNAPDWDAVWVAEGVECPTAETIEAARGGVLLQGPHWHIIHGMACDAVRADPVGNTDASDVTGMCRSFGRIESRTWRFEPIDMGQAEASGLSENTVALTHCPGT